MRSRWLRMIARCQGTQTVKLGICAENSWMFGRRTLRWQYKLDRVNRIYGSRSAVKYLRLRLLLQSGIGGDVCSTIYCVVK